MAAKSIEIDVRTIPPRERHPLIFQTFDSLERGDAVVVINSHDPRPLRNQFTTERPNAFEWTYEAEGPEVWRVRIERR